MFNKMHKNESGQAALETAIILIAFVVVASVFAFTILSAGSASTEKGKQAIAAGMENVQSSMEVKGSVVGTGNTAGTKVVAVGFTVAVAPGGAPVDLSAVQIAYRHGATLAYLSIDSAACTDASTAPTGDAWCAYWVGSTSHAGTILKAGELVAINMTVPAADAAGLGPNEQFAIEVKPPSGAVLKITRATPADLGGMVDLN